MTSARRQSARACAQRGAYAVEFAFVFLLAFALLYGALCYGMLFAFRLGLQNAAEDGARAALRYQPDFETRRQQAVNVATARVSWMPGNKTPSVSAQICAADTGSCDVSNCGLTWSQRCRVTVTIQTRDLGLVLPPMPNFALPSVLIGQASILLDARTP
ncbi:TadE/TadG family type IV pilus assembly protein [Variovorax sp.]|jgi:Flp pilus assembly protein TadG|uniref:TadE/TadG family type IV pilus assembly protein n=1 Tax=Variovorax sp. TaxID=1871043 RepID=UPI0011F9103D|nr:TadE/TadG family type IV pilus assembly protein [Variovorax sp.]TAJ57238.1 MAG: pilus assembly protein [Variovorax sp.]